MGWALHLSQLSAILRKNFLLKRAKIWTTIFEIGIPVLFMALLILIKSITTLYDSPNVNYSCGNAFPWYGTTSAAYTPDIPETYQCGIKPDECTAKNYYRDGYKSGWGSESFRFYPSLGYVSSAMNYPYFTYTIQDNTSFINNQWYDNPSLPFDKIIERITLDRAILAVAPRRKDSQLQQETLNLQSYLQSLVPPSLASSIKYFKTENDLEDYTLDADYEKDDYADGKVWLAIVVIAADTTDHTWEYKIRANFTYPFEQSYPTVGCLYRDCEYTYTIGEPRATTYDLYKPYIMDNIYGYGYTGFLTMQQVMDQFIFWCETGSVVTFSASISMMSTQDFISDDFQYVISDVLGIFYMLSFLYPVSQMVRLLVLDKEEKIKEGMKMMGLSEFAYNLSWLISLSLQMAIISLLITLITADSVFEYSDKTYVFAFFFAFSLAIMSFCFLLASVFSKSKTAALIGPMLFFALYFPYYAVNDDGFATSTKMSACILAPTCFALGATVFGDFEGGLVGVQESNIATKTGNISYNDVLYMLLVDALLYGVVAWYLDKVFVSEYGTQLPWYFPVTRSYWFGVPVSPALSDAEIAENTPNMEPVSHEFRRQIEEHRCVQVKGLRKVFHTTGEDRVAVNNLHMEMFENQITVLLGHNGAGKSTTISMLTGLIPPTSGDAFVRGLSINTDMNTIRSNLGVCPQHNVLFPELTVLQHLTMYAIFKGVPSSEVEKAAKAMIAEVGLVEKTNVPSGMLSGGMKRKLSLGIALIGDSKVVILDEPTSGMDPFSRRSTWNVLQRNKRGRIILLTTHFMDEADYLGDRIAIMAAGQLKCFGSSLFLKNKYGVGYTLTIVRNEGANRAQDIEQVIKSYVPTAEPLSNVGAELSFRLPFAAASYFTAMFAELDARKAELNFAEYGISVTTLEEVFLRVGHEAHAEQEKARLERVAQENKKAAVTSRDVIPKIERLSIEHQGASHGRSPSQANRFWDEKKGQESEVRVFLSHFMALFRKRVIYGKRDKRMFICQLVLPTLLVALGLALLQVAPDYDQPNLVVSPSFQNPTLKREYRNPVPIYSMGPVAQNIGARFNNEDVYGYAVEMQAYPDQFEGCAQGAEPLLEMSNFLIGDHKPESEHGASRYGAITISENTTLTNLEYNVMVNGSSVHGPVIYPNLLHQAALQEMLDAPGARITIRNHPLPRTFKQNQDEKSFSAFTVSLFLMIAFCFIPASYALFVVKEREIKAKHQQIISGVSLLAYWSSTFAWDVLSYVFPLAMVIILIHAFDVQSYAKGDGGVAVFLTFLTFGPSVAAFTYLVSFLFKSHSTAQNVVMFLNFITGLCLMVVSFTLTLIPSTTHIAYKIRYLFRLFPSFCLGDGLLQLALCQDGKCPSISADGYDFYSFVGPFHWNIAGANLVFMGFETVVYFGLVVLIEYLMTFPFMLKFMHLTQDPGLKEEVEDSDVAAERQRVANGGAANDVVRIQELRKVYPSKLGPKVAVQSLSFGIPKGECFGFLGINGAGKTTTLSILSGEFPPSSGSAFIAGYDIMLDQSRIRRKIGYCPQFDALLDLLTVREHLELYARIKGIPSDILEETVQAKLDQMDLNDFANKAAGSLSGGNKRKLSVAIALMGEPSIVFLDEPSTGMDPVARRFMWEVIARISTLDRATSIILTTHSMEEAEALCTRIGIMVNGRLRCLGSSQHLKLKFGSGFEVDLRTRMTSEEDLRRLAAQLIQMRAVDGQQAEDPLAIRLTAPFNNAAAALGNMHRADDIAPEKSGSLLHDALTADGFITVQAFLEWWCAEDYAVEVDNFIVNAFGNKVVMLVERSTAHSFRYRVNDPSLTLSEIFGKFEHAKTTTHIESYSLGQTTLEQIFNQFAASQENPEVAAAAP